MTEWQPIVTAPTDGTDVLAFIAVFADELWQPFCDVVHFQDGSWWNAGDCGYALDRVTHWMPLPALPVVPA